MPGPTNRFQSLLFWIGREDAISKGVLGFSFQSLLFWIGREDQIEITRSPAVVIGFNPCCFGLVVKTARLRWPKSSSFRFQSLLFWIGREDIATEYVGHPMDYCFNPCCFGLVVKTGP